MKKVIFVGGTSFSGSTLFHLMLANDPKGFALGEIRWLLYPQRAEHVNRLCGCGDPACTVWQQMRRAGGDRLYEAIFDLFPEVEFIVDSSKEPFWIQSQAETLARRGIEARHLLIWKTPLEFAASSKKRNRLPNWDRDWINYHRLYVSLLPEWKAIAYAQLKRDEHALRMACEYAGIPWFDGKEAYWNRTYHAFGGNRSATFHLYDEQTAKTHLKDHYDQNKMRLYRRIYDDKIEDRDLETIVQRSQAEQPIFQSILHALEANNVCADATSAPALNELRLPAWLIHVRRLKLLIRQQVAGRRLKPQPSLASP
ncbi:MAG: hypothetical protein KJZ93_13585 [Caldilineaceae bacterium]|nr:hypothetical protein [Caldilineaceae bacterium]